VIILATLIGNLVYQRKRNLIAEHGLSIHFSYGNTNILFDTGQGPNFIVNAKQL
jgi:metal-dependent hydrolase (beta-lactamase superfamily II)